NPVLADTTGAFANNGQSGQVFFIGSGISTERTFNVPAGKAILFPTVSAAQDNTCVDPPVTVDQHRATAASIIDQVAEQHVSAEGVPLQNLSSYRFTSPVFA